MNLIFDLDGTLADSSPGILRCIAHATDELNHPCASDEVLRGMIGRPLRTIFATILDSDDPETLDRAVDIYRSRFRTTGYLECELYPGVVEALDQLADEGHLLQIVTAKPSAIARRVLEHFDIATCFRDVHGPALADHGCDKVELVGAALNAAGGHARDAAVIGDRADDLIAGRAHGLRIVAVAWGYGSREELLAARPDYLAETVPSLVTWLRLTAG